ADGRARRVAELQDRRGGGAGPPRPLDAGPAAAAGAGPGGPGRRPPPPPAPRPGPLPGPPPPRRPPPPAPRRPPPPGRPPGPGRAWALMTRVIPTLLGSYYWPPDTVARRVALLGVGAVYAAAVALAAVRAARPPWWGRGPAAVRAWGWRALLLVLVGSFALL